MSKFKIEIIETLTKIVIVNSDTIENAIDDVRERYRKEEIVLDSDNYLETEIQQYFDE